MSSKEVLPVLRIGLVGSGFIAKFHLQALMGVRNCVLTGVFSPTEANRTALARRATEMGLGPPRAGWGRAPAVTALIPGTPIYHVGVRRDEATLQPSVYATNLPARADAIRHLLILDPMLATGGSALAALRRARAVFAGPVTFIGIIGAPLGAMRLGHHDRAVTIHLAALDDGLDSRGYIVPGLGDAGDRAFGAQA